MPRNSHARPPASHYVASRSTSAESQYLAWSSVKKRWTTSPVSPSSNSTTRPSATASPGKTLHRLLRLATKRRGHQAPGQSRPQIAVVQRAEKYQVSCVLCAASGLCVDVMRVDHRPTHFLPVQCSCLRVPAPVASCRRGTSGNGSHSAASVPPYVSSQWLGCADVLGRHRPGLAVPASLLERVRRSRSPSAARFPVRCVSGPA